MCSPDGKAYTVFINQLLDKQGITKLKKNRRFDQRQMSGVIHRESNRLKERTLQYCAEKDYLYDALWHACAGPLVAIPRVGEKVFYSPQGHLEQVEASISEERFLEVPVYDIPSAILCKVVHIQLKAELDTDDVFAQITLVPEMTQEARNLGSVVNPLPVRTNVYSFRKILTASDTSSHGGLSVPKRLAEECLPPLDMSCKTPSQDVVMKDLHGVAWRFRHIYRGQPKRHMFTGGWSTFISSKRLVTGDSFIFIRGENGELRVGVRRAHKSEYSVCESVLSKYSMQLGVLASASYAISTNTMFTVYYRPRTSPSEFIIPYVQFMVSTNTPYSAGMRFRMKFEGEECTEQRFAGTIVGMEDVDHVNWPGSKWRCLMVQWDDTCTAVVRPDRVSPWNIELLADTTAMLPAVPRKRAFCSCPESSSLVGGVSFRSGSPPGLGLSGHSFPEDSSCWTGGSVGISRNSSVPRFGSQNSSFREWKTHQLKQEATPVTQSKGSGTCMIFGVDFFMSSGAAASTFGISESSNLLRTNPFDFSGKQCQNCCITSRTCAKVHKYGDAPRR
ncbi:hypothetical protein NE237_013655 [Protea cynaroides]|uniref:Auxin response factor n=1 Tax=Protea cynaroides TaxID=273540 RepID=A0A9Q0GZ16_9MAGN|nr:hypothetical protein NE237_013655 [Protea cynaroides]